MMWLALSMPYLAGALALLSLFNEPFIAPMPNAEGVVAMRQTDETPCSAEGVECWRGFYRGLMDLKSPGDALSDLKARTLAREDVGEYCHELLHDIGERAYEESGSVARAYSGGDPFCRAGYYHGVLEGAFGIEGPELIERLDELCSQVPGKSSYSYQYFSCVHGIGHGLMAYFSHDIFRSLDGCTRLSGEWEVGSCAGGVFMENAMDDAGDFRDDDLLYPCTAVSERFRDACFLMQTSHVLEVLGGDFAATFDLCRTVAEPQRTLCFESLGRDASGWSYGSAETAHAYCSYGADTYERDHCMIGAAVDFIQGQGGASALALCTLAEGASLCRDRVRAHLVVQLL